MRHHPPERLDERVVDRLLEYRDAPPDGLGRTPGPKTLLAYLQRAQDLQDLGLRLPRSTCTIYRLLKAAGRITRVSPPRSGTLALAQIAGVCWQMDFKDASSVTLDALGKHQHLVEVLNIVDIGSSQLLEAEVREDFHAQTTLTSRAVIFRRRGRPIQLTCDRDPRFVASPKGSDFPNALRRFLSCLDIDLLICPPQRPDRNAFVERYHRSYQSECLSVHQPRSLQEVRARDCRLSAALQPSTAESGSELSQSSRLRWLFLSLLPYLPFRSRWIQMPGFGTLTARPWNAGLGGMAT